MKTEHIIEKEDMQVKIEIYFSASVMEEKIKYRIADVKYLPKRKRKWLSALDSVSDYCRCRRVSEEERGKLLQEECLKYVTEQDIKEALDKTYEALKPVFSPEIFQR